MIQHNNFPRIATDAIARATAQNDTILKLELNLVNLDCEIFTLILDLESVQIVAEKAIAFDANYKNDAQRKNALQSKLNQAGNLAKRKALQQLKARKAQAEAHLGAAKRLYQLALIQAQSVTSGGANNA
ncbi:hypothetical protein [Microcoleus sp. SVA1_A1]|uniref:hypothetical protein n=1 Tax=Microcoleus sp. SVA1_A1 TaxID=2818946 RepID=UPI002FD608CF